MASELEEPAFAHPLERLYARLLDEHGIPWEYEPHTFPLAAHPDGSVAEAVTPDFFLPTVGAYVETTTATRRALSRKRSKFRRLGSLYGVVVTILGHGDLERLLGRAHRR